MTSLMALSALDPASVDALASVLRATVSSKGITGRQAGCAQKLTKATKRFAQVPLPKDTFVKLRSLLLKLRNPSSVSSREGTQRGVVTEVNEGNEEVCPGAVAEGHLR